MENFLINLLNKKIFIKNLSKSQRYTGFTLAEVLIVLGVIGIVAAMTIPSLILNAQNNTYNAAWKKTYNVLANATNEIISDQSGSLNGVLTDDDNISFRDLYKNKLSWVKSCDDSITEGCYTYTTDGVPTGRASTGTNSGQPALVLNDGTLLWFNKANSSCSSLTYGCGQIMVDVNGNRPPNLVGVDIFAGYIKYDSANNVFAFAPPFASSSTTTCVPCSDSASCTSNTALSQAYACSKYYLLGN